MKKLFYILILSLLFSLQSQAQEDDLILSKKLFTNNAIKAVFVESPFVVEESFITSPNSKIIYAESCSQKFLMPYEFNLFMNCKPHLLVDDDKSKIIKLYLSFAFFNSKKPDSEIEVKLEENTITGIYYNYIANVEYKDKNYKVFIRFDKQIERIDYYCDDVKIGFKIPKQIDFSKNGGGLEAEIPEITVSAADNSSEQYFTTSKEFSQMYYHYLTVTENDIPTDAKFNVHIHNLDVTNYYMYSIIIRSMTGVVYDRKDDLYSENGTIDFVFEPERYETGICEVLLFRKNVYEENYQYLKSFDAVCLVPEHKISKDLPFNQGYQDNNLNDYTIYYTDDFFKTVEEISISDYLNNLESSYIDTWKKSVYEFQMLNGVSYTASDSTIVTNKPIDFDKNIELAIYDGNTPYHGIGKYNGYDGSSFTYRTYGKCIMYLPSTMREPDGYKPEYANDYDAISTSVAEGFHHFVMHSWKPSGQYAPNWVYNAQPSAMQSIITNEFNSEFKLSNTHFNQNANSFLKNMDTPIYPDIYENNYYDTKERFSLYWRFLFENSVPNGNERDRLKIFKAIYEKVPIRGSLEDIRRSLTNAFESVPQCIYKTMNQSFIAFTEKLLYIDPVNNNWNRWYSNKDVIYNIPKYEKGISWVFGKQYDGLIRGIINNTYGIKLHSISMNDIKQVLNTDNIDINFAGNKDAQWGVVVALLMSNKMNNQSISYVIPLEKSLSNYTGSIKIRRDLINQAGYDYEIQDIRIGVVRLDTKIDAKADYSITIKQDNSTMMAVVSPLAEYPTVIKTSETSDLTTAFTVLAESGLFVKDFTQTNLIKVSLTNAMNRIPLTVINTSEINNMYQSQCTLPAEVPTGYYNVEIEALNNNGTSRKAISASSVYILNDYGCSGQIVGLTAWYNTSVRPQLLFENTNLLKETIEPSKNLTFNVVYADDNQDSLHNAKVYCRRPGTGLYYFFNLVRKNNKLYEVTIPDSIIAMPSIEFYITATTSRGIAVSLPEFEPQKNPLHIAVQTNEIPYIELTKVPEFTLLSLDKPLNFSIKATDNTNKISKVGFVYRTEGELVWQNEEIILDSNDNRESFDFQIPAGFSGLKNIEYNFYCYDNFGIKNEIGSNQRPILLSFILPPPVLISPADKSNVMDYTFDFTWQDMSELYYELANQYLYRLQISKKINFDTLVYDTVIGSAFLNDVKLDFGAKYFWRVSAILDEFSTTWSNSFEFNTVRPKPEILKLDYLEKICVGEMLYLGVETNEGIWNYDWYKNGKKIENNNNNVYIIDSATLNDSGTYYCVIRSLLVGDTIRTKDIKVRVYDQPYIVKSPASIYVKPNYKATFELKIDALGFAPDGVPRIEWYRGGQLLNNMERVVLDYEDSTQTYRMHIYDVREIDFSKEYYVIVYGRCDELKKVISEKFALMKYFDPTTVYITRHPVSQEVCHGNEVRIKVETQVVGKGTITYKWYRNGTPIDDNDFYFGTDTKEMVIRNFDNLKVGEYKCKISISPDETFQYSDIADIIIYEKPYILSQSLEEGGELGENLVLFVNVSGAHLKFKWFKDDDFIYGADTKTYVIPNYSAKDAGSYICMVYNDCDTIYSKPMLVTKVNDNQTNKFKASLYPNPVSGTSNLSYYLEESAQVNIKLFASTGQEIATLVNSNLSRGWNSLILDTQKLNLVSGSYFIHIQTESDFITIPLVLIK